MGGICSTLADTHTKLYLEAFTQEEHLGGLGVENNSDMDTKEVRYEHVD